MGHAVLVLQVFHGCIIHASDSSRGVMTMMIPSYPNSAKYSEIALILLDLALSRLISLLPTSFAQTLEIIERLVQ